MLAAIARFSWTIVLLRDDGGFLVFGREEDRSPVDAFQQTFLGHVLEVATNRGRGNVKPLDQLADADAFLLVEDFHDLVLTCDIRHLFARFD